jgi:flagellar FliL protein
MTKRLFLLLSLMMLALPFSPLHAEEEEEGEKEAPKKAVYHAIGDKIVVNIKEGSRNRFMQIKVQAMTRDEKVSAAIEANQPALRHAMIMLFAHQEGDAMRNIQQREQVRGQALTELQKVISELAGISEGLEAVYFTDFVIQ